MLLLMLIIIISIRYVNNKYEEIIRNCLPHHGNA